MVEEKAQDALSTRGLVETDIGPLRRLTGILDSLPTDSKWYGEGENKRESVQVSINLKEIEVLEAIEPYHFPTYTITIPKSNRKKSRWGVLSEGVPGEKGDKTVGFNNVADLQYTSEQLDPKNSNYVQASMRMSIRDALSKRIGMVVCDGEDGRPPMPNLFDGRANDGKGADVPTPAWTVYSIEGVGMAGTQGKNATELAMDILNGKTLADFNKEALDSLVIRSDTGLLQSISLPPTAEGSFASKLVADGKFTVDEAGIYHKV